MPHSQTTIHLFNKQAKAYQDKFMDLSSFHDTFDIFCQNIPKENAAILDIACGPGNITQYLLKKRPDFNILGIDLAPNMLELAKINNPSAQFQLMDCKDISQLTQKYEGIMCGFCLPYLSKEEAVQFIKDASKLLKPQGVLYISTMENDYSKSGFKKGSSGDEMYTHYHQADYLMEALKANDFEILHVKRQDYPTQDGTKTTDLVLIGIKAKNE